MVVGAVDPAVVLQEEPLGPGRVPGHLVHALAELRVPLALGEELGADPVVARLPGRTAVSGLVTPPVLSAAVTDNGSVGCGSTVERLTPNPAFHSGRCGWSHSALERERLAAVGRAPDGGRPVPAYTTPSRTPGPAARPAPRSRRCRRGSGPRRSACPARSRRGRRTVGPGAEPGRRRPRQQPWVGRACRRGRSRPPPCRSEGPVNSQSSRASSEVPSQRPCGCPPSARSGLPSRPPPRVSHSAVRLTR